MAEQMSKEQQIGFHKGAADTLMKEKAELLKMVNIVDQILQGHLNALKQLGSEFKAPESVKQEIKEEPKIVGEEREEDTWDENENWQ